MKIKNFNEYNYIKENILDDNDEEENENKWEVKIFQPSGHRLRKRSTESLPIRANRAHNSGGATCQINNAAINTMKSMRKRDFW